MSIAAKDKPFDSNEILPCPIAVSTMKGMPTSIVPVFGRRRSHTNGDRKSGRFQLRRTNGKQSQLEWQFGQELNELFELHPSNGAPADRFAISRRERTAYDPSFAEPAALDGPEFSNRSGSSYAAPPFSPFRTTKHQRSPYAPPTQQPADSVLNDEPQLDTAVQMKSSDSATASSPKAKPAMSDPAHQRWQRPSLEGEIVTDEPAAETSTHRYTRTANGAVSDAAHDLRHDDLDRRKNIAPQHARRPRSNQSPFVSLFMGEDGHRRVLTTRMALDDALDRWWTHREVAPLALLRDGLLVLEAGHELDETQRSFLLRTALRTGRGMITALHYQLDADRTAFLLKEALLDTKHTFDPKLINFLRMEDEQSVEWADYLEHDLAYEATVASGKRSQLAAAALHAMRQPLVQNDAAQAAPPAPSRARLSIPRPLFVEGIGRGVTQVGAMMQPSTMMVPLSHRWSLRWLFWACTILLLLLTFSWPQLRVSSAMVEIPAGTYLVSDPVSSNPATTSRFQTVTLDGYRIDQQEVSNLAYRSCWEQNVCPIPTSFDSQTRPGYFANRSYDTFPVVNVSWRAANTYCEWVGKRLPTLEEWEVAASLAPATGRRFIYPWGDRFDRRLVNGAVDISTDTQPGDTQLSDTQLSDTLVGDTQPSGTYHPAGSTSSGIMDMAGNVAEWTAMPAASMVDGFVVKGGSFLDGPEQLRNSALVELQEETAAPWLGFRCAADQ